jgi:hypothetical protein
MAADSGDELRGEHHPSGHPLGVVRADHARLVASRRICISTRGTAESSVQQDAAAFCQAISKMAGLALANLKRVESGEACRTQLKGDLKAAREAQRLIMPPAMGALGAVTYAMQTKPRPDGRWRSVRHHRARTGDDNPDGRVAVFLGDVTGKGVGAADPDGDGTDAPSDVACVTADDPADVMERNANRYVTDRIGDGLFISPVARDDRPRRKRTLHVRRRGARALADRVPAGGSRRRRCRMRGRA